MAISIGDNIKGQKEINQCVRNNISSWKNGRRWMKKHGFKDSNFEPENCLIIWNKKND